MSRKTEQIYKEISHLEDLQNQISIINQLSRAKKTESEESHHLENIEYEMAQSLKSLRFWISSLYSYNGKSTSNAKKNASKENGKKGGRPPKEITTLKRRKMEIEDVVLPELRREKSVTTDFELEEKISAQISDCEKEISDIENRLATYEKSSVRAKIVQGESEFSNQHDSDE